MDDRVDVKWKWAAMGLTGLAIGDYGHRFNLTVLTEQLPDIRFRSSVWEITDINFLRHDSLLRVRSAGGRFQMGPTNSGNADPEMGCTPCANR